MIQWSDIEVKMLYCPSNLKILPVINVAYYKFTRHVEYVIFLCYSTTILVQRVITTLRNPSCGWRASWLETQTWSSSPCLLCCRPRSPWIHSGNNRSRKISKRLKRRRYQKTTKIFSLFNAENVVFTESKAYYARVLLDYIAHSSTFIEVEDSFFETKRKINFHTHTNT